MFYLSLKNLLGIGWQKKKMVYDNFIYNFSPIGKKSSNCMLFAARGNGVIASGPRVRRLAM
jgi:hypothetical protein